MPSKLIPAKPPMSQAAREFAKTQAQPYKGPKHNNKPSKGYKS
jgi:hypothetical protein